MKLYRCTLSPKSSFATPLKGDTIFGHLCWMISYKFGNEKLKLLLDSYKKDKPFLIVSDGFAKGYLPKPNMPSCYLDEDSSCKKENRKKIWLTIQDLQNGNYKNAKKESVVNKNRDKEESVVKNSINYKTFTTTKGDFAPYTSKEYFLNDKDIYFLLDQEQLSLDEFNKVLELFAMHGYGKDISTGKGRFKLNNLEEIHLNFNSKAFMTLSPSAINTSDDIENLFYEPFVRFGKFGGKWVYYNAFKKPILFANSAAVVDFKEAKERKFFGQAITNIALSDNPEQSQSVQQGYSILFPLKDLECKQ